MFFIRIEVNVLHAFDVLQIPDKLTVLSLVSEFHVVRDLKSLSIGSNGPGVDDLVVRTIVLENRQEGGHFVAIGDVRKPEQVLFLPRG